jgi:hypothetical protein
MKIAVVVALLATAAPALAESDVADGPPGVTPPIAYPANPVAPPAKPAEPKKLGLDALQTRAASNRGLVGSTAVTVPEGKVEVTLQAVVPFAGIASLNAGITKTTELWIDGASTAESDYDGNNETAYGVGVKQVLFRDQRLAFALTGSLRKGSGLGSGEGWKSLGAVGSLCLDDNCGLVVSGALQQLFTYHDNYEGDSSSVTMLTFGVSAGTATTRFLIDTVTIDGDTVGFLGMRLGNQGGAFDFGFAKLLGGDGGDETIPWLGLTGRL